MIPVAARSKAWVCGRSFARIAVSNPASSMVYLSLASGICYQLEVPAMGPSFVQRNPTGCTLSECDREASRKRSWHTRGCCNMGKEIGPF
jgi:hypothetical protein